MKKRILALLLCVTLLIPVCTMPAYAYDFSSIDFEEGTYDMPDPVAVMKFIRRINSVIYTITGNPWYSDKAFRIRADETMQKMVDSVFEQTGVDFEAAYSNIPDFGNRAEIIAAVMNLDVPAVQAEIKAKHDALRAEGKIVPAVILRLFGMWLGNVELFEIKFEPYNSSKTVYQPCAYVTYADGRTDTLRSDLLYNTETQDFSGTHNNSALLGYGFNAGNSTVFTAPDSIMRVFGFCFEYDIAAYMLPLFFSYTTQRIKFEYGGKEWLVQLWKGRYAITNGCEVGFYNRDAKKFGTYYNVVSDDELFDATLDLYHGDDLIFSAPKEKTWWISRYKIATVAYMPHTMTLVSTITMHDADMLKAFTAALDKNKAVDYTVKGLDVTIKW